MEIKHFGMFINNIIPENIYYEDFLLKFQTDIVLGSNKTALYNKNTENIVSESNIYLFKKKTEVEKLDIPLGYTQIQYYKYLKDKNSLKENIEEKLISKPPLGPIYIGTWCEYCDQIGPNFHSVNCLKPNDFSLNLTLLGIIICIEENKLDIFPNKYIKFINEIANTETKKEKIKISQKSEFLF